MRKIDKDLRDKSFTHDSSKNNHDDYENNIDSIGTSTTHRKLINKGQYEEKFQDMSFNNISNSIANVNTRGEQDNDLSNISNNEGILKRRKLFEVDEIDVGSTFRNINQRKDYYQDIVEGESGEENVLKQETSRKLMSSFSKKEINPMSVTIKYTDTFNSESDIQNKRESKDRDDRSKQGTLEKNKFLNNNSTNEENTDKGDNKGNKKEQTNKDDDEDDSNSESSSNSDNSKEDKKQKKKSKKDNDNSSSCSDDNRMTESQYKNNPMGNMLHLGLPGLKMTKDQGQSPCHQDMKSSIDQKPAQEETKKKKNFINFKRKIRSKINLKQFLSLKRWHFKLIGDPGHYMKNEEDEEQEHISKFFSRIKTFSPTSFVVVVWHLIILLILLIQLFFIPMKAGFQLRLDGGFWLYFLRIVPALAFSIEILLKFNTGYYEEGQIIMDRKKIIGSYIKWKFWIDLTATSSILANQAYDSMWLDFIQFLHIQQITNLIDFLDDHFQISQRFQTAFELVKLVFLIVVVAHFCGCAFHFIAQVEIQMGEEQTWLQSKVIVDESWEVRYLNSLYWAIITMNTVGYGDICPNTTIEKIYVTFNTLVCCGVFGYAINTIGSIVREIQLKEAAYKQIKYDISMYMRNRNISREVQLKVFKSLEYQNQQELEGTHKASQILERVPGAIQNEVFMEFYGKILHQCKLFRFHFSERFINALSMKMKESTIGPGETLFKQGEQDSRIFFILKGEVQMYVTQGISDEKEKKFNLTKLQTGSFFGYSEFFTNQVRQFSCHSTSTCNFVSLTNEEAVSMLKDFQKDYVKIFYKKIKHYIQLKKKHKLKLNQLKNKKENFCMLRDNLLLYGNSIDQKCLSCHQFTHSILDCPLVHLSLDKDFYLKKSNFNIVQKERGTCSRKDNSYQTLISNNDVRYMQRKIRIDIIVEQRPDFQEVLEDCLDETDEEFLKKTPGIKYNEGNEVDFFIVSEESEEEDQDLDMDLEEVRSNINPFQNNNIQPTGNQIDYMQMNSLKSNNLIKAISSNQQPSTMINNNQMNPKRRQSQQNEFTSQRQTSMTNNNPSQSNRRTSMNYIIREQNTQPLAQYQQEKGQHSMSSMTEIQLQPTAGSTVFQSIYQLGQSQTQQPQQQFNQNVPIIPGLTQNVSTFHGVNPHIVASSPSNTSGSALVSFSTAADKQLLNTHSRIQNSNLLNVDTNDIYQASQVSKRSQQKNLTFDDNRSQVSSRSQRSGGKKDYEKQDSHIQKPQEEAQQKKGQSNNNSLFGVVGFDDRKDYENYFPHNNLSKILEKMKQKAEVKLIGTLNVALNIGNLQMRKGNAAGNLKLLRSSSRVQHTPNNMSFSSSNIQEGQNVVQSPSRFRDTIVHTLPQKSVHSQQN